MKKLIIFLGLLTSSLNTWAVSDYCLFIDSNSDLTYVMANDCGQIIADDNCDSGEALATCDGGSPDAGCTLSSIEIDLELQQLHQRDLGRVEQSTRARRMKCQRQ